MDVDDLQGETVGGVRGVGDLGDVGLVELRVVRNFDASLPFLLPGVRHNPVVIGGQGFAVRKFHGADQVGPNLEIQSEWGLTSTSFKSCLDFAGH